MPGFLTVSMPEKDKKKVLFENKTVYTKAFCNRIRKYENAERLKKKSTLVWITLFLLMGSSALAAGSNSWLAWTSLIIGFLIIPMAAWIIPAIKSSRYYQKFKQENNGNELIVNTIFTKGKVIVHDAENTVHKDFKSLEKVRNEEGLFILVFHHRETIYLDPEGFLKGEPELFSKWILQYLPKNPEKGDSEN
jgi:hypothetical protein